MPRTSLRPSGSRAEVGSSKITRSATLADHLSDQNYKSPDAVTWDAKATIEIKNPISIKKINARIRGGRDQSRLVVVDARKVKASVDELLAMFDNALREYGVDLDSVLLIVGEEESYLWQRPYHSR